MMFTIACYHSIEDTALQYFTLPHRVQVDSNWTILELEYLYLIYPEST